MDQVEASAPGTQLCKRCDRITTHKRDEHGKLHCVPCVIEQSMPGADAATPLAMPTMAMPVAPPKKKRSPAEIAAIVVTALVLAVFAFAVYRGIR
jgi:hypothetical protein